MNSGVEEYKQKIIDELERYMQSNLEVSEGAIKVILEQQFENILEIVKGR